MRGASTLNRVSRRRSLVGRVASPAGASNARERSDPAMMRIADQHNRTTAEPDPLQSNCMRGWTIPLGRWIGVVLRGLGLFLVLVSAVMVRETARLLVAAWLGLRLRAILLLPIGGLFAYANPASQEGSSNGGGQ